MTKARGAGPNVGGWREALLNVSNLELWQEFYLQTGDWEIRHEGEVQSDLLQYLRMPNTAARETVLAHRGTDHGLVRLISCLATERHPLIRSNGRPWETGGWFDLNARVDNMAEQFNRLQDAGWSGVSDPVEWTFGSNTVQEWLAYGPDGINWALIERIAPPLDADARPGRLGPHFNATQIVSDAAKARLFYEELLGFEPIIRVDDEPMAAAPGQNVLGLPESMASEQRWNIAMLQAPGPAGGAVEVISLPGLSGRDFSANANPPNRGIVSLRFPVDEIMALHQRLSDAGIHIINKPQQVQLPPEGTVVMMTVRGPEGARLDFYQAP